MTTEFIALLVYQPILVLLGVFLYHYFVQKGKNRADREDKPQIAALVEAAKAPIQEALALEIEKYRTSVSQISEAKDREFQVKFHAHGHTLNRVMQLDAMVSELFWLDLDRPRNQSANQTEWEKLTNTRRYVFDSTMYISKEIISVALDIVVKFEILFRFPKNQIQQGEQYYRTVSDEISLKIDKFKDDCRARYHFDSVESTAFSAAELQAHHQQFVKNEET